MARQSRRFRSLVVVAGAMISFSGLNAPAADARDANRPASAPTGGWWESGSGADSRIPERTESTGMPRPGSGSSNVTDFPGSLVNEWISARTVAARARAIRLQAQSDLYFTIRRVKSRFDHTPEYSQALADQNRAYADYNAARQRVLNDVANQPKYHAISLLRDQMGEKITNRRTAKDATREELLAMATLKLQFATDARSIEVAALDADTALQSARERMITASRRVSDLNARFEDALPDNPEVVLARRNLAEARVAVVETAAFSQSAAIASDAGLNYAYNLHRNDNGGTYGPYGPNGVYGAAYTTPYWGR